MPKFLNLDGGALFNASALPPSSQRSLRGIANNHTPARAQREQDADAQIHKTPAQVEGALRATVARSEHDDAAANLAEPHARADGAAAWDSFVPSASDFLVGCADPKAMEDTSTGLKVYAGKYERTTDGFGQCGSFGKGGRTGDDTFCAAGAPAVRADILRYGKVRDRLILPHYPAATRPPTPRLKSRGLPKSCLLVGS